MSPHSSIALAPQPIVVGASRRRRHDAIAAVVVGHERSHRDSRQCAHSRAPDHRRVRDACIVPLPQPPQTTRESRRGRSCCCRAHRVHARERTTGSHGFDPLVHQLAVDTDRSRRRARAIEHEVRGWLSADDTPEPAVGRVHRRPRKLDEEDTEARRLACTEQHAAHAGAPGLCCHERTRIGRHAGNAPRVRSTAHQSVDVDDTSYRNHVRYTESVSNPRSRSPTQCRALTGRACP